MRRLLPLALLGLLAVVSAPAAAEDASVQATAQNTFTPGTVTVNVGDTVTWTSAGGINHTVTSSSENWSKDSNLPAPTSSTNFTFEAPGTYTYFCETHGSPTAGMRGAVVVRAPATTRPPTKSPTPTRTSTSPRPTATASSPAPSGGGTPSPSPSSGDVTAAPIGTLVPPTGGPVATGGPRPSVPLPSLPVPSDSPDTLSIGSGGLGRPAPTGRERGLPVALAVVAIGGVVTAQFRALLSIDRQPS